MIYVGKYVEVISPKTKTNRFLHAIYDTDIYELNLEKKVISITILFKASRESESKKQTLIRCNLYSICYFHYFMYENSGSYFVVVNISLPAPFDEDTTLDTFNNRSQSWNKPLIPIVKILRNAISHS